MESFARDCGRFNSLAMLRWQTYARRKMYILTYTFRYMYLLVYLIKGSSGVFMFLSCSKVLCLASAFLFVCSEDGIGMINPSELPTLHQTCGRQSVDRQWVLKHLCAHTLLRSLQQNPSGDVLMNGPRILSRFPGNSTAASFKSPELPQLGLRPITQACKMEQQ